MNFHPDSIYASPRLGLRREDCHFYHTMDVPGVGVIDGDWDLRSTVDAYLGGVDLKGQRVLEIGPASGFLSFEMERRGAILTAIEVKDEPGWDFVPFPDYVLNPLLEPRREVMAKLKNSWWFNHEAFKSQTKLVYTDVYNLPDQIGRFDIAILGAVLLHAKAPLQIVEQCARKANALVISDMFFADLEGSPTCRLIPNKENGRWDTWWEFSTDFFIQFLGVMGFETVLTKHNQYHRGRGYPYFTIVARRPGGQTIAPSPHRVDD